MAIQHTFERHETKFLLTKQQYEAVLPAVRGSLAPDIYAKSTVSSIYFDTDSYELIRASIEKPAYKEKLRLRSYGAPGEGGLVFAEIKKKVGGIVYKRRLEASPKQMAAFFHEGIPLPECAQIQREIRFFLDRFQPVPKVFIGYEREAFTGGADRALRVTFDENIRWRTELLTLAAGDAGVLLLPKGMVVMEIKTPLAVPLWLTGLLSACGAFPVGFSKYGTCYQNCILPQMAAARCGAGATARCADRFKFRERKVAVC